MPVATQQQKKKPKPVGTSNEQQSKTTSGGSEKTAESARERKEEVVVNYDPKLCDVICYNCGDPAHYVGTCSTPKLCFICHKAGHHMDVWSEWYKPTLGVQMLGWISSMLNLRIRRL